MVPDHILPFEDRHDGGRVLAAQLRSYARQPDVTVLALPRGGVPVGYEVARALGAPLDVFVVRKLGVPGHPELAMGAIASGGVRVLNADVLQVLDIAPDELEAVGVEEQRELERREELYRGERPPLDVADRTVIVVDDGLATGSTMLAAVRALKQMHPARVIVAVPVASAETCRDLRHEADEVVCAATPRPFRAVGVWYRDFPQLSDGEVHRLLDRAARLASGITT